MELFKRRYLCIICFAFILTSFALTFFGVAIKLMLSIIAAIGVVCGVFFFIKTKKYKFGALFALLICVAVSLSSFNSLFFVSRIQNQAIALVGRNTVLVKIVSPSAEGEYNVRVLRAGERNVNIKAEFICDSDITFEYGDELIFNADIDFASDVRDRSKLLSLALSDESDIYVNKEENKNYFSVDGIRYLCYSLQEKFSDHVDKTFGDHSALAKGLLVNDVSDIDTKTQTDFKRSGTSHILAVSGMHIALLMGAVELLLRKIEVKKEIRIAVISVLSIFFLALTGFVASAVRSVLMLFAVYLCYILYEENDSITALFASVAIIILFSPFAVYDLGMWMSFLATLGILAVYPVFDERMPYPKQENLFVRYSLRFIIWIAKTLMLTVVANFFLLPIMWCFFGTASISTFLCNLILSPIVTVLMPLCAFSTLLGFIPYVYIPFVFLTNKLFDIMMLIVRYFSEMRFGVISLQYEFAGILVVAFTVTLAVMLIVKLKHKLIVFLPMVAFTVAFCMCFSIFTYNAKPYVQCVKARDAEIIFVNCGAECSVFDVGRGDSLKGNVVVNYMSKYATEIDEYFIIYPNEKDAAMIDTVCKNTVIRKLYISKTLDNKDLFVYYEILKCAEKYNISVELYEFDSDVEICNGVLFNYNMENGFSIYSDKVTVKKHGDTTVCEYRGEIYDIEYLDRISNEIPLN